MRELAWRGRPRPTDEGHPRLPGADWLSFTRNSTRALGGSSGSALWRLNPALSHPHVSDAAGTGQAGVCGDAASMKGRPAPPRLRIKRRRLKALQRSRCAVLDPVPAFSPEALALIHLDRAGPRTSAGVSLRKLLAHGYGPRTPELTAFRRPGLRMPRPSVGAEGEGIVAWGERAGKKAKRFFCCGLFQDPSPTPPHKGEGLDLDRPASFDRRTSTCWNIGVIDKRSAAVRAPPPCGEGLGRGLSCGWEKVSREWLHC